MSSRVGPPAISDRVGKRGGAPAEWWLHWILRIGIVAEFVGHGAFGVRTKVEWLAYFGVFGIPEWAAWKLMVLVGLLDITLAVLVLFRPRRVVLLHMAFWGCMTALLRPAAGQGWWEFFERTYNFGGPLALLLLHGHRANLHQWLEGIRSIPLLGRERLTALAWMFRVTIAGYLVGHGGYGAVMGKANLLSHYASIGLTALVDDPAMLNVAIGWFEIGLGVVVLLRPTTGLALFVFGWKLATEALYPISGAPGGIFEFVERGSSYAVPLALICVRAGAARLAPGATGGPRVRPVPTPVSASGTRSELS